jgi:hypothetical protein
VEKDRAAGELLPVEGDHAASEFRVVEKDRAAGEFRLVEGDHVAGEFRPVEGDRAAGELRRDTSPGFSILLDARRPTTAQELDLARWVRVVSRRPGAPDHAVPRGQLPRSYRLSFPGLPLGHRVVTLGEVDARPARAWAFSLTRSSRRTARGLGMVRQ